MTKKLFQWTVVGAGPAGILAVGKLLDHGVLPTNILWLDPYFTVGDLGLLWRHVSSNTAVKLFLDFLKGTDAFAYKQKAPDFPLNHLPLNKTCSLSYVVEPLQWISDQLVQQVTAERAMIHSMALSSRIWSLESDSQIFKTKNVILATGAIPSSLNYPDLDVIPFNVAIDKNHLAGVIDINSTYGVFGSSHSGIMIVRHLLELGVKKVINFYRNPCRYAINMGDWILFDNTGLKGDTAVWAREYIDGTWPPNLVRYNSAQHDIDRSLLECDKVIYAVGFEKRNSIAIHDYKNMPYNPNVGIIGPGLFGLGIAYPELKTDPFGTLETQVGLWKFMAFINKVLPAWFKYHT